MKSFLACIALSQLVWVHAASAQILPTQYCPVAADFVLMPETPTPEGYIGYSFRPPVGFTSNPSQQVDEPTRVVTLRGQAYLSSFPLPWPVLGALGPLNAGPYRLVVSFTYDTPQGPAPCPIFEIPFTVGGSGTPAATPVPFLDSWMLAVLAGLLASLGLATRRRRLRRNVTC